MQMRKSMPRGLATTVRVLVLALGVFCALVGFAAAQTVEGKGEASPPAAAEGTHIGPAPVFTPSDIDAAEALRTAQRVSESGNIQTDIPEFDRPEERSELMAFILRHLTPILRILGWILLGGLILGLLLLLFLMFTDLDFANFRIGRRAHLEEAEVTYDEEEPLWSRDALARADALAREGQFSEAIHVLLLGSFGELKARRAATLPPALTSREIVQRISMSPRARDALSLIIGSVEISYFGGQDVSEPVFTSCRNAFLQFAEPEKAA